MKKWKAIFPVVVLAGTMLVPACAHVVSRESSLPASHPEALAEGRVACSECHEEQVKGVLKPYASFEHSTYFIRNHRFYAEKDDRLCATCHKRSFCNDCHVNEVEIKPSTKFGNRPDRDLPHRGDYLTLHKIDGRIDPTSCFRCHGRNNNEQCVVCHRQ